MNKQAERLAAVSTAVQAAANEAALSHLGPDADRAEVSKLAANAVAWVHRRAPYSPEPQQRAIHIASDLSSSVGSIQVSGGLEIQQSAYGYHINEGGWCEWEISILFTSRQDGNTSWMVTLTDVDGSVKHLGGLTAWAIVPMKIASAIRTLTGGWTEPITVDELVR